MSELRAALHTSIDVGLGGVLLANMLAGWLDSDPKGLPTAETAGEPEDHRTSPEQVRHHQESTERQYALREKALELGWSQSLIRTLDRDLGKTGTEMAARQDFKTLVADVSLGQVGAVIALEVSRLARSNL